MTQIKNVSILLLLFSFNFSFAQKSEIYTNQLQQYNHAVALYNNDDYAAAQFIFNKLDNSVDKTSEIKANIAYYKAFSAIKLNQYGAVGDLNFFVEQYPTNLKSITAYLKAGNYYFKKEQYYNALKWYYKVGFNNLTIEQQEALQFNKGYSLLSIKKYKLAKTYFSKLLNSKNYADKSKYYYGYLAYVDNDYENANKYLSKVTYNKTYAKNISYYLADINFKMGHFNKAINIAIPLLKKVSPETIPILSKIIGESYFNLKKYDVSIPYLLKYKGKNGKWNNTDYYQLGYAFYQQNDYQNAISWFNKIVNGNDAVAQNASYYLADCYLKTNNKLAALNAFRKASKMNFNVKIKEQAFYNYAKLGYEIGNPYNNVAQVFINYLKAYPNGAASTEINKLLINAFMRSKDYKGALAYYKNAKDATQIKTYQKAAYFYGVQLFLDANYKAAIGNLNKALTVKLDNTMHNLSLFWRGESYYRLSSYYKALSDFKSIKNLNIDGLNYNIGYTYFKLKNYQNATVYFKKVIDKNMSDKGRISDSYLRLGDSYYALSNYAKAITTYNKAILKNKTNIDYALYKTAKSYGLINDNTNKIKVLQTLINNYSDSNLFDKALFELGDTYLKLGKNKSAIKTYNNLINNNNRSTFRAKALLKEGLIYNNQNNPTKALEIYKRLVKDFNNAPESRQAVKNAKEIYSQLGELDKYEAWTKNLSFVTETDNTLDKAMYNSAENFYLQSNFTKAATAFYKYLKRFPNGTYVLEANYYIAISYISTNQSQKAISPFKFVINQPDNNFTEQALIKLTLFYLEESKWDNAMPLLSRLEKLTQNNQNKLFAQSNLMKVYFAKNSYKQAINYADKVLSYPSLKSNIKSDAQVIIARSAFKTNNLAKAEIAYKEVDKFATGKLKAEAIYYNALFKFNKKQYKASNKVIQNLASNYAAYRYFGAKGLLIMAQNFYGLKDAYQATYILESVLKNFKDYPDVITRAKTLLKIIKTKEAQTNTSVKK